MILELRISNTLRGWNPNGLKIFIYDAKKFFSSDIWTQEISVEIYGNSFEFKSLSANVTFIINLRMFMGTLRRILYTTHKSEFLKRMECRMYLERIFEELLEKISRNFFKWSWSLKFLVTKYPLANDSEFHQILNLKLLFKCIPKVHSWSCILQSLFCNEPINIKLEEKN